MRVHSRHGFDRDVAAVAVPQSVRLPDDHLEGGEQAYFLRGSVREDVAQVDESVVEDFVVGRRADGVGATGGFARGEQIRIA